MTFSENKSEDKVDNSNVEILREIQDLFIENHWTLGLAESCTGGLISSTITQRAGVSDFFNGSLVTYSLESKHDLLEIAWDILNKDNGVSEGIASLMAKGARLRLKSTWGLAITGYAGPTGGNVDKPVGTVCWAVSGANIDSAETAFFNGTRLQIQQQATQRALEFLLKNLRASV